MQQQEFITIVCISDTHCNAYKVQIPPADILIHCGDFTSTGQKKEIEDFIDWLKSLKQVKHKIVIAGNHEVSLDANLYRSHLKNRFHRYTEFNEVELEGRLRESCHYLLNSSIVLEGYKFWGSPYSLEFYDWGFPIRHDQSEEFWQQIDPDADFVITHGPPFERCDMTATNIHAGDVGLLKRVQEIKPLYHLFGHIHEAYGSIEEVDEKTGKKITFINCSTSNLNYRPVNKPVIIKLPKKQ